MSVRELRVALVPEQHGAAIALYRDGLGLSVLDDLTGVEVDGARARRHSKRVVRNLDVWTAGALPYSCITWPR